MLCRGGRHGWFRRREPGAGGQERDPRCGQEAGSARLRRRYRHSRLRVPRRFRQMAGARHRLLPRDRHGGARRCREGQICRHHLEGPLLGAAIGRDRCADPRFDPYADAQHRAWPRPWRDQLLHRRSLHGEEVAWRRAREGAQRSDNLCSHRHDARAQHRGFRACQQHQDQYLAVREARRGFRRRRGRTVRRLYR